MNTAIDAQLFAAAERVRRNAHVPYSHFPVGAAILADDGAIYAGCNVENAAYPLGNCAEASAIAAMIAAGAKRITRIYITGNGDVPVTPCGGCRQRIREFADLDVPVDLPWRRGRTARHDARRAAAAFLRSGKPGSRLMSTAALNVIRARAGVDVSVSAAIVLGSGLAGIGELLTDRVDIAYADLEGFPGAAGLGEGVSGHGKDLLIGSLGGKRVAVLTGREHYYENGNATAMRPALETVAELGAQTLLLTNSAGSLDANVPPGELMMLSDHINYAGMNPLIGEPTDRRFVNMVDCYDPKLRDLARTEAEKLGIAVNEGVYLWYSGPSFETVAEIKMAITLGANAVGMSTAPEVIIGRMLGMTVWACSSITNMGAGLSDEKISHEHTKTMAVQGADKLKRLIPAMVEAL